MECKQRLDCGCSKCYSKLYYLNNREKILAYQKKYYYQHSNPKTRRNKKSTYDVKIEHKKFIISFK